MLPTRSPKINSTLVMRLYAVVLFGTLGATLVAALILGGGPVWVAAIVTFLVLGLVIIEELTSYRSKVAYQWRTAIIVAVGLAVYFSSYIIGGFLNFLVIPLLIVLARTWPNRRVLVYAGLLAVALVVGQQLYLIITDQEIAKNSRIATIGGLGGVALALTMLLRNFQNEVENYRKEQQTKASEMEVAHEIQTSLMPPSQIETGNWIMSAKSIPARDVGGDFYEYVPYLDRGIGGIAIGDVAGKGIPAALQMAVVRTLFRVEARRRIFPSETLNSVNTALQAERSFGMVTMLYAFVDPTSDTVHFANAGHNFPFVLNGRLEEVRLSGLPLGIDDQVEYEERSVKLAPGTSIILYTDGVVEAIDKNGEMYGDERLREVILAAQHLAAEELVSKIMQDVATFTAGVPQSDDITVVILHNAPVNDINASADAAGLDSRHAQQVEEMFASITAASNLNNSLDDLFEEDNVNWI